MSNIDKRSQKELYAKVEQQAHKLRGNPREYHAVTGMCPVNVIEMQAQKILALLDELEPMALAHLNLNLLCDVYRSAYEEARHDGLVNWEAASALAEENEDLKRKLASLEAEPVEVTFAMAMDFHHALNDGGIGNDDIEEIMIGLRAAFANITAPAAPAFVPDELTREEYKRRFMEDDNFNDTFRGGWNSCRAAMLQSFGNSEQLNSTVIPDGYVLVPVEPTAEMVAAAMLCDDVLFDTEDDTMFRVQHGVIWRTMLAAAPQQEVKP